MDRWQVLSRRMEEAGVFMRSRIAAPSLLAAVRNGRAVYKEEAADGPIIGYAGIWDTPHPGWLELGAIWVADEHRKKGLGSVLYDERLALIPRGYRICVLTGSDEAAHLALTHGFTETMEPQWYEEVPRCVSCVPCDKNGKRPGVDRPDCPMRGMPNLCRMFVWDTYT